MDKKNQLENIQIILVESSHSGNIGSVLRAMKTMGLQNLTLINPIIKPDSQTIALAAGASDLIHQIRYFNSLEDAISDSKLVIGTSARERTFDHPIVNAQKCAEILCKEAEFDKVSLVFGREKSGLTNEELYLCDFHMKIETNPIYGSLNLAMAVQILTYEIRMAFLNQQEKNREIIVQKKEYPTNEELYLFYQQLEENLVKINFIQEKNPGFILEKLRMLFSRARIEKNELHILRGIFSLMNKNS